MAKFSPPASEKPPTDESRRVPYSVGDAGGSIARSQADVRLPDMREIWLKGNVRMPQLAAIMAATWFIVGGVVLAAFWRSDTPAARVIGFSLLAGSILGALFVAAVMRTPRLAFEHPCLLVFVNGMRPIRVPIEIVECFLLGQGPALLPGENHARTETATVVIKLSDRAEEWSHRAVDPRVASWCDGYITIRGTWTEPLNVALIQQLNQRLAEVVRQTAVRTPS